MRAACALLAMGLLATSCSDGPSGPSGPGHISVSVTTPFANDGAVVITLTGPGFGEVQPADSTYRVFSRLASGGDLRVAVIGDVTSGPLFSVAVDDVASLAAYRAVVTQAATRSDSLRADPSGYSLSLAPHTAR